MRPQLRARRAPTRPGTSTAAGHGLAQLAVPRLRSVAIVLAALAVLFAIATTLRLVNGRFAPAHDALPYLVIGFAFLMSSAMAAVTYLPWPATLITRIGLAFQIAGAFCIALIEEQGLRSAGSPSIVGLWILSFPLIPQTPRRAFGAAFGAAAATPLALLVSVAFGLADAQTSEQVAAVTGSNVVHALLAIFTNRVIYNLGREVADAKQLGAYRLVEKLGHGGMGEVWRAEHRALARPAAIKLMRPEMLHGLPARENSVVARFEREVQATARLTSPHTVAVYDFGATDDGRLYYVMELLHGLDAETVVTNFGPLPAERVIYLLRQVCESLGEAHAAGLVHRDIKPANLYLCTIGRLHDFVKVLDFGLAHDATSNVRLTADGSVPGTPAFLAPEIAAHNTADARSDIYALGCVAYFLLTGRPVFDEDSAVAMMAAHLRDAAPPPSSRTELPIPRELEDLVLACLAKDPDARPRSMDEVRRLLDAIALDHRWNQDRAAAWWQTHAPIAAASYRAPTDESDRRRRETR